MTKEPKSTIRENRGRCDEPAEHTKHTLLWTVLYCMNAVPCTYPCVRPEQYTVHSAQCTVHSAQCSAQCMCTVHSAQSTLMNLSTSASHSPRRCGDAVEFQLNLLRTRTAKLSFLPEDTERTKNLIGKLYRTKYLL
jgi:hypothetical protein